MNGATPTEANQLIAMSRLLLAVVLLILFSGLVLTIRVGRFFFPRPSRPRVSTKYVDVWAEAGRRATVDPADGLGPSDADDEDEEDEDLDV